MARVHQLLPTFSPSDAMGQVAIGFQRALRHLGHSGEVFAEEVAPAWQSLVRPLGELRTRPDDLVLYHHGIASPLAGKLMHLPCRTGVVFHNITPARFYEGRRLEEPLKAGRAQLAALADTVELSIGVSQFNARELEAAGHRNVHVVPLFVEPERFSSASIDARLTSQLSRSGHPRVVSVSRVVPHKRMEDLLSLHEELRRLTPEAELWVVGDYAPGHAAFKALAARARKLGGVRFLGKVSHAELVAAYRAADVFVSMSEHEGFGVPLIEAMAADLPVLAFGAAAVPETMGGRGIVFDEKHFAALAELVLHVTRDDAQRLQLIEGQRERVASLSFQHTVAALERALPVRSTGGTRSTRRRVGVVVQRYGEHITGGAEAHARSVATRLADHADVTVLTTCATDHLTWANVLPAGVEQDGAVTVRRFPVRAPRSMRPFNRLSDQLFGHPQSFATESHWIAAQGPDAPGLLDTIAAEADDFDAFLFFTYLYAPTVWGVPQVAEKALVVPTAHDEPPLAFHAFSDVFETPAALLTNTVEETALIERRFSKVVRRRVVGVGIEPLEANAKRFAMRFGLRGPYLLYVGRMDAGKGVADLVTRHQRLVRSFHDAPHLVLAGGGDLQVSGTRVHVLGRIDEQTKWDALSGAFGVVVPSRYESLSLLTLEAFAAGVPVLGNEDSEVVRGQLERSGAGLPFKLDDDASYREAVQALGDFRPEFVRAARKYARQFTWDKVIATYLEEIDRLRPAAVRKVRR